MKEREINEREIEKLEKKENSIEMDYYDGKLTEERREKLIEITQEERKIKSRENLKGFAVRNRQYGKKVQCRSRKKEERA